MAPEPRCSTHRARRRLRIRRNNVPGRLPNRNVHRRISRVIKSALSKLLHQQRRLRRSPHIYHPVAPDHPVKQLQMRGNRIPHHLIGSGDEQHLASGGLRLCDQRRSPPGCKAAIPPEERASPPSSSFHPGRSLCARPRIASIRNGRRSRICNTASQMQSVLTKVPSISTQSGTSRLWLRPYGRTGGTCDGGSLATMSLNRASHPNKTPSPSRAHTRVPWA